MKIQAAAPLIAISFLLFPGALFAQEHVERDYELAIARGELALASGDAAAAADQFRRALALKPADKPAVLYLASAYSRADDLARAQQTLENALAADPADGRLHYELGTVLAKLGNADEARRHFDAARAAPGYELPEWEVAAGGRFSFSAAAGFQYDSNVILEPDNPLVPGKERRGDWRAVVNLDGNYVFYKSASAKADVGYHLYQSLHRKLEDFNVQQHTLSASASYKPVRSTGLLLTYSFTPSYVSAEHYSTENRLEFALSHQYTQRSLTELALAGEEKRFITNAEFPSNAERNASNGSVRLGHTVMLTRETAIAAEYSYDKDSADVSTWDYTGNRGALMVRTKLPWFTVFLSGSYYDRKYGAFADSPLATKRRDEMQEYGLTLSRDITRSLAVSFVETYIVNDSNLAPYEYTRSIIGLAVEVKL